MLGGKTSIEHILHSHWRAITDINWHNTDPNLVVSTAIDGWLWAWDLRTPQKPVSVLLSWVPISNLLVPKCMGLCAFNGELIRPCLEKPNFLLILKLVGRRSNGIGRMKIS